MNLTLPHTAHSYIMLVTNFGDSGFLGALAMLGAIYLYLVKRHEAALALFLSPIVCAGVMAFLKIYFIGCHQLYPSLDIHSPSGHAAMSATVYGTYAAIVASHFSNWRRPLALFGAFLFIGAIAASRVLLHTHTLNEVLLGLAVGSLIAWFSFVSLRQTPKVPFHLRYLLLISLIPLFFLYGSHTPAEKLIEKLTAWLQASFSFCT